MKFNSLSDITSKTGIVFNNQYLVYSEKIIEIFNSIDTNNVLIDCNNPIILHCLGLYFEYIKKDYGMMKKYYLMAIGLGESSAMNNLGLYYEEIEKDYEMMKKYYAMAIDLGNSYAMNNLGLYCKNIEKDYESMKKYYLMAIDLGNSNTMNNLSLHYSNDELELYKLLSKISNKNELVKNKLTELENNKIIKVYTNKIRTFKKFNSYSQCVLCLESDVLNINYDCGHLICTDCYNPNSKCGLCL